MEDVLSLILVLLILRELRTTPRYLDRR